MFDGLLRRHREAQAATAVRNLEKMCLRLLSEAGSANSASAAARVMGAYAGLPERSRLAFFEFLDTALRPDAGRVLEAATAYAASGDAEHVLALQRAVEPPRQELLRRVNGAAGGTAAIIAMRRDLLKFLPRQPQLRAVDSDFRHLLGSWFNPGFLALQQLDWNAPAVLLEKIIEHEAVHAIKDWSDLRRRLQTDRRCFAFFHPQLPGEPLIFVEVALVRAIPRSIDQLIDEKARIDSPGQARVAAFYSISNCEPGLAGVSLGNFLIKRVAERLQAELPALQRFCTLSPIPTLRAWVNRQTGEDTDSPGGEQPRKAIEALRARYGKDLGGLASVLAKGKLPAEDEGRLEQCAAVFLSQASAGPHGDPVARFHLHNGARLERINVNADPSPKGVRDSFGVMVNYLYDLGELESNHERFMAGEVAHSARIRRICRRT